ncbi:MAG: ABC transporter ATP-binding protein [Clostridia bacterium]|nr:ABC transporter ATP-binding protein [Clostridia bacterium]
MGPRPKVNKNTLPRTIKLLFQFYPKLIPIVVFCIIFAAIVSAIPSIFTQKVLAVITASLDNGTPLAEAMPQILPLIGILIGLYVVSISLITLQSQLMAYITQGFLSKMRCKMFDGMQNLPIKYFDTHKHGDIMSHYTNDIDTLRQLISQSLPSLLQASIIVVTVLFIMLYYSIPMTLVVLLGVVAMFFVSKKIGGGSAKYFIRQQKSIGKTEGFIQEMMNGQRVVKVFCHEDAAQGDFDALNEELYKDSYKANAFANSLGPIIMNIGNVLYVACAMIGGVFLVANVPNFGLGMFPKFTIDIVVPFLNMTKQFTGNVNQVSQQINHIAMGLAGAERLFALMDETPEVDNGYVTLINAVVAEDGTITESATRTGRWAWKHPHTDGTITYTLLQGDVRLTEVDFAYEEGKPVLHDVSVYAEPGQKVAFVGSTGAGKTTITNLINRFYDIADGKVRYDGININKIKKADLRRSLGIVLQDTNLFTGTVMENIRYGNLEATDEECRQAARLAGADDFITRLPQGYDTLLQNNGANLSQGQRQLIAIARAAVADPPVMILDEATSSIDTRTEAIVQRGMDKLMEGRTVFVIAHRLSTIMDADVIMVLEHGRIIERGDHATLLAQKGTYYQLYTGAFELE